MNGDDVVKGKPFVKESSSENEVSLSFGSILLLFGVSILDCGNERKVHEIKKYLNKSLERENLTRE